VIRHDRWLAVLLLYFGRVLALMLDLGLVVLVLAHGLVVLLLDLGLMVLVLDL